MCGGETLRSWRERQRESVTALSLTRLLPEPPAIYQAERFF